MAAQDLERDDSGVSSKVIIDLAVEDLDRSIIRGGGKQRFGAHVERDGADSALMVAESLVGLCGEVEVVPEETFVVGADDDVGAVGVDGDGGDPFGAGVEDLEEVLFGEVVDADVALGGEVEVGLDGVEFDELGEAWGFAEGELGFVRGEMVDVDGVVGLVGGGRGEVVAFAVPGDVLDWGFDGDGEDETFLLEG